MSYQWSFVTMNYERKCSYCGECECDHIREADEYMNKLVGYDVPEGDDDRDCPIPHGDEEYWAEIEDELMEDEKSIRKFRINDEEGPF